MIKLLFKVSDEPGVEPLLVEVPGDWVDGCLYYFELVGDGVYVVIKDEGLWAYRYARDILKGPWPEMEDTIKKSKLWAYNYADDVLKLNWSRSKEWVDG